MVGIQCEPIFRGEPYLDVRGGASQPTKRRYLYGVSTANTQENQPSEYHTHLLLVSQMEIWYL